MPWVTRGLRDGILTTSWPRRPDAYADGFRAAVEIVDDGGARAAGAIAACPTGAIARGDDGTVRLDRGRCILCGRCVRAAPDGFRWSPGSQIATLTRRGLVAGAPEETDEALAAVRAELAVRVRRLRRSVHIRHVDTGSDGSDEWEVQALTNPVYDLHRLGLFFTASPRHADILLLTGIGAGGMAEPVARTIDAMPEPIVVVASGVDAISGGVVGGGYTGGVGVAPFADVDVWVPGSPATPFALLHGILLALGRMPERRDR